MKRGLQQKLKQFRAFIQTQFKNLYPFKLEYLNKKSEFLDVYNLPKLSQDEINNLNRSITPSEIEPVIKNSPVKSKMKNTPPKNQGHTDSV